ncbi:MAG: bifunctional phosphopantothenoylcysteine decarboxylase/phosphopantothenate--cysteine ligase CoaBC [Chloroflexota bacterium]|nr:bifunctional phosphopantothenoylcysteine decarboxylase/phosphopantothenate--cysteine ligase CoaBC [Chloroflexota bacterium]
MDTLTALDSKRIVLGVTGSIAAYKAADLASKLTQAGAQVDVVLTDAAQKFITPLTFQALTGRAVYTDLWRTDATDGLPTHIAHVGLAEAAAAILIAPATADTIARLAGGFASDLLAITVLAARCPLILAPAMDGGMYEHPAVQDNLALLKSRGAFIIEPEEGRFASGLTGRGRLPDTPTLMSALRYALSRAADGFLARRRVVITAGGTREPLDPVRYLTNRSSGKQGHALAEAAIDAGADVTLITAARGLPAPYGVQIVAVETAKQMHDAVLAHIDGADALIMAAAVADFRPASVAEQKIKKLENADAPTMVLERNPDILGAVKLRRGDTQMPRVVVGFAAESQRVREYARDKLARKGLDLIVANDITAPDAGFDVDTNRVTIYDAGGGEQRLELTTKARVSEAILRRVAELLGEKR